MLSFILSGDLEFRVPDLGNHLTWTQQKLCLSLLCPCSQHEDVSFSKLEANNDLGSVLQKSQVIQQGHFPLALCLGSRCSMASIITTGLGFMSSVYWQLPVSD